MSRDDSWTRRKRYVGLGDPAGANGWERWPRFCGEVPPELAAELDERAKRVDYPLTHGDMVRAGLRLYLNAVAPEPDAAIDSTAVELVDLPALERGDDDG